LPIMLPMRSSADCSCCSVLSCRSVLMVKLCNKSAQATVWKALYPNVVRTVLGPLQERYWRKRLDHSQICEGGLSIGARGEFWPPGGWVFRPSALKDSAGRYGRAWCGQP
jgi:hypothetical protein